MNSIPPSQSLHLDTVLSNLQHSHKPFRIPQSTLSLKPVHHMSNSKSNGLWTVDTYKPRKKPLQSGVRLRDESENVKLVWLKGYFLKDPGIPK